MAIKYCNGRRLKRAILASYIWLGNNRDSIDRINVYPVPDGDTGTNMFFTLREAAERVKNLPDDSLPVVAEEIVKGTLLGAKGNSGVILSQFFKGFADGISQKERLSSRDLASALAKGKEASYKALRNPVEGTILTVIKESVNAALKVANGEEDITTLLEAMIREGGKALKNTTSLLPELSDAGVVDAGGEGFVKMIEGVYKLIHGEKMDEKVGYVSSPKKLQISLEFKYCTEFMIKGVNINLSKIEEDLASFGNSILVVGDRSLARVHLHTNHPNEVLEYAKGLGELFKVEIDDMEKQGFLKESGYEIITDSTCDLPKNLIEQYGIKVVPLWVKFGERLYRDGVDMESWEFYKKLRKEKVFPKTSQPSPEDFAEVYRKTKKGISIHISSEMSGTYNAALLARDIISGIEVDVVDSRLTSIALGLVVLEAARVAKTSNSNEDILRYIKRLIPKVRTFFTVSTLEFLHKGGRIGGAKKFFGEMLKIKPILGIEDGKIVPVAKVRGETQLLDKIISLMRREVRDGDRIKVGIVHADRLDVAQKVRDTIQNIFNCSELIVSTIGSIIGAHVGPGAWGVAYYKEED